MTKHDREIMEILEAFDLTGCAHSAARLAGADPHTVARYVAIRDAGGSPFARAARRSIIDAYLEKIEELVERSRGEVRADVVHWRHVVPMGFSLDPRGVVERRDCAFPFLGPVKKPWSIACGVLVDVDV